MNLTEEQKEKIKLKLEEEHKVSEASSKEKYRNEFDRGAKRKNQA